MILPDGALMMSYSSWSTYQRCEKKWYWQYAQGLECVATPDYFLVGDLTHALAAMRTENLLAHGPSLMGVDELAAQWILGHEGVDAWEKARAVALALIHGYDAGRWWVRDEPGPLGVPSQVWRLWADDDDGQGGTVEEYPHDWSHDGAPHLPNGWNNPEAPFVAPIRNPTTGRISRSFVLRGRIDCLWARDDGVWIVEYKTVAPQTAKTYMEPHWWDMQSACYAYAWEEMTGVPIVGVVHQLMVKPSLKRSERKGETWPGFRSRLRAAALEQPERHFLRVEKPIPPSHQDEALRGIWRRCAALRHDLREGTWPPRTDQCALFGRCDYWDLCWGSDDPNLSREDIIARNYTQRPNRLRTYQSTEEEVINAGSEFPGALRGGRRKREESPNDSEA